MPCDTTYTFWMCATRMNGRTGTSKVPCIFPITISSSTCKYWIPATRLLFSVPVVNAAPLPVRCFNAMGSRSSSMSLVGWRHGMRRDLRRCNTLCIFLLLQYVKQAVYPKSRSINVYCRDTGANALIIASNRHVVKRGRSCRTVFRKEKRYDNGYRVYSPGCLYRKPAGG